MSGRETERFLVSRKPFLEAAEKVVEEDEQEVVMVMEAEVCSWAF